jgi:hypothetical protein
MRYNRSSDMQFNCRGKILRVLIIVLKWPNFKLPLLQRANGLRNRHASGGRGILRNLARKRGTANFFTVFEALPSFGGVEDKLNFAILNLVDNVWAALCNRAQPQCPAHADNLQCHP